MIGRMTHYPKVAQLRDAAGLRRRCEELGITIPIAEGRSGPSPLAEAWRMGSLTVGNRWCVHPMEGWDANPDGTASALTQRRWRRFGESGAKLIWGGEAGAVRSDGRANPRQLMATPQHVESLSTLRRELVEAHRAACDGTEGLVVGLQLTHSGRFSRPNSKKLEPRIAYHHPLLDEKFGIDPADDSVLWTDTQLDELIGEYAAGAKAAAEAGFDFVDVKACHGYLLHEFLSARERPGPYGGDLLGRSRLLCSIIEAVRRECPGLEVGVRLSVFDRPPFRPGEGGVGEPVPLELPYRWGFGLDQREPLRSDLSEPVELLKRLKEIGVAAINVTCGSPYSVPHVPRPAIFPPSDGYLPPEDPLVGVARQIAATAELKAAVPGLPFVGSGYTYLQDFLPAVAAAVIAAGMADAVGLGRMVLSYPAMPLDELAGRPPVRKQVCRTFSDCTTAARRGLVSGCYPLDPFYKQLPESEFLGRK